MEVVYQAKDQSMAWCLDCHRNPEQHLRPTEFVTKLDWSAKDIDPSDPELGKFANDPHALGSYLKEKEQHQSFSQLRNLSPMNSPVPAPNKKFFRSVDQLEGTAEFNEFLEREFPSAASEFPDGISRRRWVQLMGASIALSGAAGCRYPREQFAALVVPQEDRVAGFPQLFATNFEWAGRVVNALVTCVEGRPIKVDGNASHPMFAMSAGSEFTDGKDAKFAHAGTDLYTQAAVLSLYDPDRCGAVVQRSNRDGSEPMVTVSGVSGEPDWSAFDAYAAKASAELAANGGEGLAIIYEPTKSPSFNRLLSETKAKFPNATLVRYESVYQRNATKALEALGPRILRCSTSLMQPK